MADTAIINIPVRTQEFERFLELWHGYSAELDEQPGKWDGINAAMGGASEALKKGADNGKEALLTATSKADALTGAIVKSSKAQSSFVSVIGMIEKGFDSLAKTGIRAAAGIGKAFSGAARGSVAEMGAGFAGAAESAVSALGPVGLAVGAIGAAIGGAALGMKALADAAVGRQRSAYSLGMTPGQQASFNVNAQQFLGPESLNAAANAQSTYDSGGNLATLGIDFDSARKMNTGRLAFEMLKSATKAAQDMPNVPLGNVPGVAAYKRLGGQIGDVRNALALGLPALQAARDDANKDIAKFDLDPKAVTASAALKKSFERGGTAAQSAAINHLSGGDATIAKVLNGLSSGDPKAAVAAISHAFHAVTTTVEQHVEPALNALRAGAHHAAEALQSIWHSVTTPIAGTASAATEIAVKRGLYSSTASAAVKGKAAAAIVQVARRKGVDPTLALADALQESNLNPNLYYMDHYADGSNAGYSAGLFSLNQNGEGAGMSLRDMRDPTKNATVALSEFATVMNETKAELHNRERRLGVGDWSDDARKLTPGQIAALAERPADVAGYAKMVDAFYQAIVKAQMTERRSRPAKPKVHVSVRNSTSARVAVSANAVAMG